ncbi:dihydropteroate synthase [Sedimenticola sp.]|uniref:dihydropteroate synthase n=1 Tax=Sedimenticola sp. TaxID=1940285 RepID=UPI003D13D0F3
MPILDCAGKSIDLDRPQVMGILNVTPDSFSDGGDFLNRDRALEHAFKLIDEGADILDVGGESTRPGAKAVSEQEELDRVVPVIQAIAAEIPVPISIDTNKASVMREAVAAGAGLINDVMALQGDGAMAAAQALEVPVCLMHMQGQPRTMQQAPHYEDVVAEVVAFLQSRVEACLSAGIARHRLILDPGFGFGKTLQHNLTLLSHLEQVCALQLPVLVGVSRKSMIGGVLDNAPVDQRLYGGLACAVLAVERGAGIIRTHDVKPTADVIRMAQAVVSTR